MSKYTKQATMTLLDYGEPVEGYNGPRKYFKRRREYSVTLFCNDWKELVDLLEAPREYLSKACEEFRKASTLPKWVIGQPLTISMRSGYRKKEYMHEAAEFADISLEDDGTGSAQNILRRNELFENGAFIVEFTVGTRTILVRYFKPTNVKPEASPRMRFTTMDDNIQDAILPPTLAMVGLGKNSKMGSLHFDLKGIVRNRGEFILDYIENRAQVGKLVYSHPRFSETQNYLVGSERKLFYDRGNRVQGLVFQDEAEDPYILVEVCPPTPGSQCNRACFVGSIRRDGSTCSMGSLVMKCYCPKGMQDV